jgi:hypothetical protein
VEHLLSAFTTAVGSWTLAEDADGDHAWLLQPSAAAAAAGDAAGALACGSALADGRVAFPASWDNLMTMKNLIQEADPGPKTGFLSHLYIKCIILPRQARDKHRESTQKKPVFSKVSREGEYDKEAPYRGCMSMNTSRVYNPVRKTKQNETKQIKANHHSVPSSRFRFLFKVECFQTKTAPRPQAVN